MNWLDPEEVQEWFAKNRPHCAGCEGEYNFPQDAAVGFVKALAKVSRKRSSGAIDPNFSWGRISVCALLIAKRLEQE